MSCNTNFTNFSDINQTFIIEPVSITGGSPTLSACTALYSNLIVSCSGTTSIDLGDGVISFSGNLYTNDNISGNTFNAMNYFSGGTNLLNVMHDYYVTGGTFVNNTDTLTLRRSDGANVIITGITDLYTTGGTLVGDVVYFNRNDMMSAYTINLTDIRFSGGSGHCITDLYVTNIHGCSPITVHDNLILLSGLTINQPDNDNALTQILVRDNSGEVKYRSSSSIGGGDAFTGWTGGTALFSIKANNDTAIDASGDYSVAEGKNTTSSGIGSHAEGDGTVATSNGSHAEGIGTQAIGGGSHAEGGGTYAQGPFSHAEGVETTSFGSYSHTEGQSTTANGDWSHAEGYFSIAQGLYAHTEGFATQAIGDASHAEGGNTLANNSLAHAEGYQTTANGYTSHVEGYTSVADGTIAHAEGFNTSAVGEASHSEGYQTFATGQYGAHSEGRATTASGDRSHAEGTNTVSLGYASHAEGDTTTSVGINSHAEGFDTTASGDYGSHAEGASTTAVGQASHSEGFATTANGYYSHVEGYLSTAIGQSSHAEGDNTIASGTSSHSEGNSTIAGGNQSHAEGEQTTAIGINSHSEGFGTTAYGEVTHAEGLLTIAIGNYTHVEGYQSTAIGLYSHSEGLATTSSGLASHSQGQSTIAANSYSHAEGFGTTAGGQASHAEGHLTTASGEFSHSEGSGTTASGEFSHAGGYNSIASGSNSFVHSTGSTASGARSAVLGGSDIIGTADDTVYVPYLNLIVQTGTSVSNIGVDAFGNVVAGTAGSSSGVTTATTLNINGNVYDLSTDREWRVAQGDTGVLTFGPISANSATTINIGPNTGYVVDNESNPLEPSYLYVTFTGGTNIPITTISAGTASYVFLNSGGTPYFQSSFPTSAERKSNILLGKIGHPNGFIASIVNQPDFLTSPLAQTRDLFRALSFINDGVTAYANGANLSVNITAGNIFGQGINLHNSRTMPNQIATGPYTPVTLVYRTQTGGTATGTTFVIPTTYDVGGLETPITGTSGTTTLQYIYSVPGLAFVIQYGQTVYPTLNEGIAAVGRESSFVVFPNLIGNTILIGVLAVTLSATALNNTSQAMFFPADKFGQIIGATAGVATGSLQNAYTNSLNPEIVTNDVTGALTVRTHDGLLSNVFEGQTSGGTITFAVNAGGGISGTSVMSPSLIGSSGASGTLVLSSTSSTTKGKIHFGNSSYNEATNKLGINLATGATATLHIGATPGSNGGINLDLTGNSANAVLSYASIDFNTPITGVTGGLIGQFLSTANNYVNTSVNLIANSTALFNYSPNGQLAFGASGVNGIITFNTSGFSPTSERVRILNSGELLVGRKTLAFGDLAVFERNQNASTHLTVINQTTGNGGFAQIGSNNGLASTFYGITSSAYTSVIGTLYQVANQGFLYNNGSVGLNIGANHLNGALKFFTGGQVAANERMRISSGGTVSIGVVSATTYQNLPIDIRVTGGTYNSVTSTATFTNNTGGTFAVSGITSGSGSGGFSGGTVTGGTLFQGGLSANTISATTYYGVPDAIGVTYDGSGGVISTGNTVYRVMGYNGRITGWDMVSSIAGTSIIDVWKMSGGTLPTSANAIADGDKPTLFSQVFNSNTDLTLWTDTTFNAGDIIAFNVFSSTTVTRVSLSLRVLKQ